MRPARLSNRAQRARSSLDGSAVATPTPPSRPRSSSASACASRSARARAATTSRRRETIVAIVRGEDGEPQARAMRWGLIPPWAKDAKIAYKMINARAETADQQARLSAPAGDGRPARAARSPTASTSGCARRIASSRASRSASRSPTARRSRSPACGRPGTLDGERIESATILTTAANALVAASTTACR